MSVIAFLTPRELPSDWSQQELAELYRVEDTLLQAGIAVETERGRTEEGDPWIVFCRQETGEVIIHFARCDGLYIAVGAFFQGVLRGNSFSAIVRQFLDNQPLLLPRRRGNNDTNLFLHPTVMLMAFVTTAFLISQEADPAMTSSTAGKEDPFKGDSLLMRVAQAVRTSLNDVKSTVNDFTGTTGNVAPAALLSALLIVEDSQANKQTDAENQGAYPTLEVANAPLTDDQASLATERQVTLSAQNENQSFAETIDPAIAPNHFGEEIEQAAGNSPKSIVTAEFIEFDESTTIPLLPSFEETSVYTAQNTTYSAEEAEISDLDGADPVAVSADSAFAQDGKYEVVVADIVSYSENAWSSYDFTAFRELDEISADLNIHLSRPVEIIYGAFDRDTSQDTLSRPVEIIYGAFDRDTSQDTIIDIAFDTVVDAKSAVDASQGAIDSDGQMRTYDSIANSFVRQFIASATDLQVLLYGSDLILVDTDQIDSSQGYLSVYTWDFQDGSTISIIGIVSDELTQMIA
ncbi:MAG: hypothetical protein QGD90_03460 [Candidatus Hydrogenedentes bacterium]|nr:hypothetical protein [Candidatus Hydrogenedentota bacterium]